MRTILAISLIVATVFVAVPAGATQCITKDNAIACAGSDASGTCSNGYQTTGAYVFNYDGASLLYAGGGASCFGMMGYSQESIAAGATSCDAMSCTFAGAQWYSYDYMGMGGCDMAVYAAAGGQYQYQSLGCPAGGPPTIPALLP
jgi:hypothetical protein